MCADRKPDGLQHKQMKDTGGRMAQGPSGATTGLVRMCAGQGEVATPEERLWNPQTMERGEAWSWEAGREQDDNNDKSNDDNSNNNSGGQRALPSSWQDREGLVGSGFRVQSCQWWKA